MENVCNSQCNTQKNAQDTNPDVSPTSQNSRTTYHCPYILKFRVFNSSLNESTIPMMNTFVTRSASLTPNTLYHQHHLYAIHSTHSPKEPLKKNCQKRII